MMSLRAFVAFFEHDWIASLMPDRGNMNDAANFNEMHGMKKFIKEESASSVGRWAKSFRMVNNPYEGLIEPYRKPIS